MSDDYFDEIDDAALQSIEIPTDSIQIPQPNHQPIQSRISQFRGFTIQREETFKIARFPHKESHHEISDENMKSFIYPINYPKRDYQYKIVQTALYSNTMVCLPTGLGKTFIAAVVMFNYFRWFPNGKIVFLAPTKPLVNQQIEACFNIVGIPNVYIK
jgi:superfamily II DNA or RNA helicase